MDLFYVRWSMLRLASFYSISPWTVVTPIGLARWGCDRTTTTKAVCLSVCCWKGRKRKADQCNCEWWLGIERKRMRLRYWIPPFRYQWYEWMVQEWICTSFPSSVPFLFPSSRLCEHARRTWTFLGCSLWMTASSTSSQQPNIHVDATTAALTRAGRCLVSKPVSFLGSIIQYILNTRGDVLVHWKSWADLWRVKWPVCSFLLLVLYVRYILYYFLVNIPLYQLSSPTFCNRQLFSWTQSSSPICIDHAIAPERTKWTPFLVWLGH